jgi:hypothetical protein
MGATLVLASPAAAVTVAGGRTVLDVSSAAVTNLAASGVTATGAGGAQAIGRGLRFRISGGRLREGPVGTVEHWGGLALTRGEQRVTFARPVLWLGPDSAIVFASVAGAEVRLFDGDVSEAVPLSGSDGAFGVKRIRLRLAGHGAATVNQALGTQFEAGDPVGRLNMKPFVLSNQQEEA